MRITMPFSEDMAKAVINGRKTATTRTKRYGAEKDTFVVNYRGQKVTCRILTIHAIELERVAFGWCKEEGFDSVEGFIDKWKELHPRKGYVPGQKVYLHQFEAIPFLVVDQSRKFTEHKPVANLEYKGE